MFDLADDLSVGEFIAGVVYLVVAVRLLRRGRRSGEFVERLLAGVFFFLGASSVIYSLGTLPGFQSIAPALSFAGRIVYAPAPVMMAIFTRRVFREKEPWAGQLIWASVVLLAVGIVGSIGFRGDWEGFSASSPWFWLEWTGYTLPFVWAGTEALIQYSQARRRVKLALCDPLVCNRLLLWALFGVFQVCAYLVLFPQYAQYETQNAFLAVWDRVYSGFMISSIAMIWFVFFPPDFYKRWIGGSLSSSKAAEA